MADQKQKLSVEDLADLSGAELASKITEYGADAIGKAFALREKRAAELASKAGGLIVKLTEAGMVYIRHPSFREHSKKTGKDYVAGCNLPLSAVRCFFGTSSIRDEIAKEVAKLVS